MKTMCSEISSKYQTCLSEMESKSEAKQSETAPIKHCMIFCEVCQLKWTFSYFWQPASTRPDCESVRESSWFSSVIKHTWSSWSLSSGPPETLLDCRHTHLQFTHMMLPLQSTNTDQLLKRTLKLSQICWRAAVNKCEHYTPALSFYTKYI